MKIENLKYFKTLFCDENQGFSINLYSVNPEIEQPDGSRVDMIAVKGYNLPSTASIYFAFEGDWNCRKEKNGSMKWSFAATSYTEILPCSENGIIKYLVTLPGVGKATAQKLFEAFGKDIFSVMDTEPERLLDVKGINEKTLELIKTELLERGAGRDLFAYLFSFGISKSKISLIYSKYKEDSLSVIKSNPYVLCEMTGIGFLTADKIAMSNGLATDSYERLCAGTCEVLLQAENGGSLFSSAPSGHLFLEFGELKKLTMRLLSLSLSDKDFSKVLTRMANEREIAIHKGQYFYRFGAARNEFGLAKKIATMLQNEVSIDEAKIMPTILQIAKQNLIALAPEQMSAIKTSLKSSVSVITGGPGTGKTTIEKVLLACFKELNPDGTVCLCAPTGNAALRMAETTGYPASTVHRLLGIKEDGYYETQALLEDLVLVDEASMLDASLAKKLFDALSANAQIVFIGDVDQLSSIGAGNVLSELISSGKVPVTRLTQIFRQGQDSSIPLNCKRINSGESDLYFDDRFHFDKADSSEQIADYACQIYEAMYMAYGLDNVTVLSPFRKNTVTGIDELNKKLKMLCNPVKEGQRSISTGKKTFYIGDKVMHTKNIGEITNGDLGYITNIFYEDGLPIAEINFGGRIVNYGPEECQNLELGYAITIHKSQGSEYKIAIMICDPAHKRMLKKNLIYTAVSRAKSDIFIIGDLETLKTGIQCEDNSKRNTHLGELICEYSAKLKKADKGTQLNFLNV